MNELSELRGAVDVAVRVMDELREERKRLRWALGRVLPLVGKDELTLADREQIRIAQGYIEGDGDACHYCFGEVGHTADCPIPNGLDEYAETLPV